MSLFDTALRRATGHPETLAAAGAAVITGVAILLMPALLLQNAVTATGLPALLPPLAPPLGMKAKLGLALVAAGFAFGSVALLVRLVIGRAAKPQPGAQRVDAPPPPRARRRDLHPDAPTRAPISVSRDFGIPADDAPPPVRAPIAMGRETAPAPAQPPASRPSIFAALPIEPPAPAGGEPDAPEIAEEQPPVAAAPQAEDPPAVPAAPAPAPDAAGAPRAACDVAPEPEADAPEPIAPARPATAAVKPEATLGELLARLERAMAPRVAPVAAAPTTSLAGEAEADEEDADLRLRSALENLKRFAPRRG